MKNKLKVEYKKFEDTNSNLLEKVKSLLDENMKLKNNNNRI